jgi:hypothetical protein
MDKVWLVTGNASGLAGTLRSLCSNRAIAESLQRGTQDDCVRLSSLKARAETAAV